MRYGFIGCGNMGGAVARAVCRGVGPENVVLANRTPAKAEALAEALGCRAATNDVVAQDCDVIFLGVKPQMMADMLAGIAPILAKRSGRFVLVTMAAGLSMARVREMAGGAYPIIRIMPNTPASVGEGMIQYCSSNVTAEEEEAFRKIMAPAGRLDAVPEKQTTGVEQRVEAASVEAEEEALPKLPYADGVYVGSSRGYGGTVRVQVTMENGSITEIGILDASHETKQFLRRAKRLLTTVVEAQSWEVDAVSEATYTSRGILGAVQNALTGEVVNNPLPPQPKPAATLVVEEFTAPSIYLDGIYTAEATGFEGQITVQVTVEENKITDTTMLSAEDEEGYHSR